MSPHQEYVFMIKGNNMYIWQQQDSSMIAVELRAIHIYDGVCLFIWGACSTAVRDRCQQSDHYDFETEI